MKPSPDSFQLQISSPCPKRWDDLTGGDAKRFCDQCQKHVHNLSVVSERETSRLTRAVQNGERVCVAYQQNADGTRVRRPGWHRRLLFSIRSLAALCLPWIFATTGNAGPTTDDASAQPAQHRGISKDPTGELLLGKPSRPTPTPAPTPSPVDMVGGICIAVATPTPKPKPTPSPTPKMLRGEAELSTPTPDPGLSLGTGVFVPTPKPSPKK